MKTWSSYSCAPRAWDRGLGSEAGDTGLQSIRSAAAVHEGLSCSRSERRLKTGPVTCVLGCTRPVSHGLCLGSAQRRWPPLGDQAWGLTCRLCPDNPAPALC